MLEFHIISHHKSVAKTCYVVARDLLFFCFSHRSRTVFLGMPIRVCLHLSKIIFKAQWGWRYWRWPCWRIIYCCKKRLKNFTNLFHASSNLTFVLIYYFLCVIHCAVGSNFMQLLLYWFFWLNKCTIGWNNVWIIRTKGGIMSEDIWGFLPFPENIPKIYLKLF